MKTDSGLTSPDQRQPSLVDALIPTVTLVVLLSLSVYLFGENSSYGANQIALIATGMVAALIGMKNGLKWHDLNKAIHNGIGLALGALLILLAVGSLIGSWILAGIVPTMIYYGLQLMNPEWFYVSVCAVCALVSLSIGSSWTVAGTVGIGFVGVASGLGLALDITVGAIISGAYFGDKMSPLSDTTNLAPAVVGVDLFDHIRHMVWTTVPSILITLVLFSCIGVDGNMITDSEQVSAMLQLLDNHFVISPLLFLPMLLVMILAWKKVPALPGILIGVLAGILTALFFQADAVLTFVGDSSLLTPLALLKGVWVALFDGYSSHTGVKVIDDLLSRGGMSSMLNTVWLILSAMVFGALMEGAGLLARLIQGIISLAHSTASLFIVTIFTCIGANVVAADQFISIILPGRMYKAEFQRRNLAMVNLSRTLEDSATITSPLIPWNTCGAYMAGTLGVATFTYLPYCFFNLINPLIAIIYALLQIKIIKLSDQETALV